MKIILTESQIRRIVETEDDEMDVLLDKILGNYFPPINDFLAIGFDKISFEQVEQISIDIFLR